jgi:DNA-binding LytR/AlgR family response regulator
VVRKNVALSVPKPPFIKDGKRMLQIVKENLVYLIADGHVCNLYVKGRRAPYVLSQSFKNLADKFSDVLTMVRRGVAVNMNYVTTIENGALKLAWDDKEAEFAYSKDNYNNILSAIEVIE